MGLIASNHRRLPRLPPITPDYTHQWTPITLREQIRKCMAARLTALTEHQFKQRCAQILLSYAPGIRGMPRRLASCKANRYGRCGK